ncbi:MAG TPA: DUF5694 domain-containing protein [Rhizomicrobium sp.]
MFPRRYFLALLLAALPALANAQHATQVVVVGTFHMSNPGKDLHDVKADDVLAPKRQAEIAAIVAGLARFRPTEVDVEWPAELVKDRYERFIKGALPPSRNEVVQLGFRLARASGAAVHGVDVEGNFPYDAVAAYAKRHGESDLLAHADALIADEAHQQQNLLQTGSIGRVLRWTNEPERARKDNSWYDTLLKVGSGAEQPGADLVATWHTRNIHICANIVQLARPGDRVVVIFGAGHEFLLRQCLGELPGYALGNANDFLPQ